MEYHTPQEIVNLYIMYKDGYEKQGIPEVIIRLSNRLFDALMRIDPQQAYTFTIDLYKAIPPNTDLWRIPLQFAIWLLVDPSDGIIRYELTESHPNTIRIANLCRSTLNGYVLPVTKWQNEGETALKNHAYTAGAVAMVAIGRTGEIISAIDLTANAYGLYHANSLHVAVHTSMYAACEMVYKNVYYIKQADKLIELLSAA